MDRTRPQIAPMRPAQRLIAVAAIGAILGYFSEMLFWSAPPAGTTARTLLLTWVFYGFAGWVALVAAASTGARGLTGVFLAGSLMGWVVEGLVTRQIYAALPFSLLWTPMDWHALVSGLCGFWLVRAAARWRVARQLALLLALGAGAGIWALYWPLERTDLPGAGQVLAYLAGLGLMVPLANMVLDRLPRGYCPSSVEARSALLLTAALWGLNLALTGEPRLLAFPAVTLPALWLMRRAGGGGPAPVVLPAAPTHPARHLLFMVLPLTTWAVAIPGWHHWPAGLASNVPVATLLSAVALAFTAAALWRALRMRA